MDQQGAKWVEVSGVDHKRSITAVFCGSLTGDFLHLQVIYKGKTNRCHYKYEFPLGWHITHAPKHWCPCPKALVQSTGVHAPTGLHAPKCWSPRHCLHAPKHWSPRHWSPCPKALVSKALVSMPQSTGLQGTGLHAPKHWSPCPKTLVN